MDIERVMIEGFYSFRMVQERLVEGRQLWDRMPDPDARFGLSGRISSIWRSFVRDRELLILTGNLLDASTEETPELRALRPGRDDIARMIEASNWIVHVPEADRRLVAVAVAFLARGRKRVPWDKVWNALGRGRPGPDGLRKRYSAAITKVAQALSSPENCAGSCQEGK
jgi:hypothetical protein